MPTLKPGQRLRILIGEAAEHDGKPLHEAIVLKARDMQLAGATVMRAALGYGHTHEIHTAKILRLSDNLPLMVEIVDSQEKIAAFLPVLEGMVTGGLITVEDVKLVQP
jgi:PII-like signaling protein